MLPSGIFLSIILDTSGFYGSYTVVCTVLLREKKHLSFIQRHKLSMNMQLSAVADIYMAKR